MKEIQQILFDLDGTLTDSAPGILASLRYALERLGEPIPDEAVQRRFLGPPMRDALMAELGFSPGRAEEGLRLYRERFSVTGLFENEVYPGIPELLGGLRAQGRRLYVATSKPLPYTERILERFGLARYFEGVSGSELRGARDGKAEVIRHLIETAGVDPARAVMVGDRRYDVCGARENGMRCVGVLYGYGDADELREAGAWRLAGSVGELGDLLRGETE